MTGSTRADDGAEDDEQPKDIRLERALVEENRRREEGSC